MLAFRRLYLGATLVAALLGTGDLSFAQSETRTLVVGTTGGTLDNTFRKMFAPFEEKFKVKIQWVPGTTTENAAKLIATKANPEYDVMFLDNVTYEGVSRNGGVLAKLDTSIITNYADLHPQAKLPAMDGMPFGFFFTGFYYNEAEFKKRNWAPPAAWNDIFRPEFCNLIGLAHPNVSYTLNLIVFLSGGDLEKVPEGIAKIGKLKGCIPNLEASGPKLEEKIQLGEYLVGVHGSVRMIPLGLSGYPIRFVIPPEGTALAYTVAVPVANAKNAKLAQEFLNWFIAPASQKLQLEETYYLPVNAKVDVPNELVKLGIPADVLSKAAKLDGVTIQERRRDWVRQIERALAP